MGFLEGMHGNADNRTIPVVIGVTGHRAIRKEDEAPLRSAVKAELEKLIGLADSVEYVSDRYYNGCMKDRNARLVELATVCCISYWNPNNFRSGTGQTVRMAQKKGIRVINLFESGQTPINRP